MLPITHPLLVEYTSRVFAATEPPPWLADSMCYLVRLGSAAYGADGPRSDFDLFGVCTPPVGEAFPGLGINIMGYDDALKPFDHWKAENVVVMPDLPACDLTAYNLTGFVRSCRVGSIHMIESLYADDTLVIQTSPTAQHLRDQRQMFLSKSVARRFLNAGRMHLTVLVGKRKRSNPNRAVLVSLHGYDTKQGYHIVRLLLTAEMLASEHTLDLRRNSDMLLAVRSGAWDYEELLAWAEQKTARIQSLLEGNTLREECDDDAARGLMLECLEQRYGALELIGLRDHRVRQLN